jgi:hypothetical protein
LGLLLAQCAERFRGRFRFLSLPLQRIELPNPGQRFLRSLGRGLFGLEELPPRMSPAADFDDLAARTGVDPVVAAERIRLQVALVIFQERGRSLALERYPKVVDELS